MSLSNLDALSRTLDAAHVLRVSLHSDQSDEMPLSADECKQLKYVVSRFPNLKDIKFIGHRTVPVEIIDAWEDLLANHDLPHLDHVMFDETQIFINQLEDRLDNSANQGGTNRVLQANLARIRIVDFYPKCPSSYMLPMYLSNLREVSFHMREFRTWGTPPPGLLAFGGKLKEIRIENCQISMECFLALVLQQTSSLRKVALSSVELSEGTWDQVFVAIADSNLPLQEVFFSSIIETTRHSEKQVRRCTRSMAAKNRVTSMHITSWPTRSMAVLQSRPKEAKTWPELARLLEFIDANREGQGLPPHVEIRYCQYANLHPA